MHDSIATRASLALKALATRNIDFYFENIPMRIENAPYRKIFNWLAVEGGLALRARNAYGWPTHMHLEPTTHCNAKCPFCPVGQDLGEPKGMMEFETFKQVVDDVGLYTLLIILWGWGEPFLNKDVYRMIAYAKSKGIKLASSTNGQIFDSGHHAESLVRSGLDGLIVSIAGITQETNYRARRGCDLDGIFEGIHKIVEQKKLQGVNTPILSLSFIVMNHNEHQIPELKKIAEELGVDQVSLKKLNSRTTEMDTKERANLLPGDAKLTRFKYDQKTNKPVRVRRNNCKSLWQTPNIRFDGRVNGCGYDFHGDYHLGDLDRSSFREIWKGDVYKDHRNRFRDDWTKMKLCKSCTYAYEGGHYEDIIADTTYFDTAQLED